MLVKRITADVNRVGIFEDLSFDLNRIELNGYTGINKSVITQFSKSNISPQLSRRVFAGNIRINGNMIVPPNTEQQIDFLISPNASGGRSWRVSIIANNTTQSARTSDFDCNFTLPPVIPIFREQINALEQKCRVSLNESITNQQQQTTQKPKLKTRQGRDIVL